MAKTKKEIGKRKREYVAIFFVAFFFILLAWFEFRVFLSAKDLPFEYSVFFFGLVNFNLVLLLFLFFLVFRNLFKAFIERRRGVAGSSLRSRLVMMFFIFSSVPTILMFFLSIVYINSSFDKWFSERITAVMKSSLEVTNHFYMDTKKRNFYAAHMIAQKLQYASSPADIRYILRQQQQIYNLDAVEYYTDLSANRAFAMSDDQTIPEVPRVSEEFLEKGLKQKNEASTVQEYKSGNLVRAMVPIKGKETAVVVSTFVPLSLLTNMNTIGSAYEDLKGNSNPIQNPLKSIYVIILLLMTLMVLFCATWFGFYMAQHLSGALAELGQATRRISQGDYRPVNIKYKETEVVELAENFNTMALQLESSQNEIHDANLSLQETLSRLDERTRYVEVVLSNVSTAVISLDPSDQITTINERAAHLFKVSAAEHIGQNLKDVIGEKYYRFYRQMVLNMGQYQLFKMSRQLEIELKDQAFPCLFTISRLSDLAGRDLGTVIGFDDLTDVFNSQKIEAWKEVARRIAHEIKNPLTPIKLSAQRLQKKFGASIDDEAFKTCTDMIIQQTDEMKRLVNEFSEYARMPVLNKEVGDLNQLIQNVVMLYSEAYKKINFSMDLDPDAVPFAMDQEQIKRVLINLIENASVATETIPDAKIEFTTKADSARQMVSLTVSDNGVGVPDGNYIKLFEPYFSTKQAGSGLGLAIVSKIISDHGGIIRAYAHPPRGLSFRIDLPYKSSVKEEHV